MPGPCSLNVRFEPDNGTGQYAEDEVKLTVVDLHLQVDRNRDLAGQVTGVGTDLTDPDHPMKFWINNDNDIANVDEEPTGVQDGDRTAVRNQRDLEDFQRMRVFCNGVVPALVRNEARLALRWVDSPSFGLRMGVFEAADSTLGLDFVRSDGVSNLQRTRPYSRRLVELRALIPRELPNNRLQMFSPGIMFPAVWTTAVDGGRKSSGRREPSAIGRNTAMA